MIKYSRQREAILKNLQGRCDHPTAEVIYDEVRKEFPHISLGTVYRNLSLLEEIGQIQKIPVGQGPDRFDYNEKPHLHFVCTNCGEVSDFREDLDDNFITIAQDGFKGVISSCSISFSGLCPECNANN